MFVLKKLNLVGKESEKMWLQRGKYQHNLHLLMGEEMRKPSKKKKRNYSKRLSRRNKVFGNLGKNDELPLAKLVNLEQFPKVWELRWSQIQTHSLHVK